MAAALSLTLYDHTQELVELLHQRMEATDPEDQAQYDAALTRAISGTKDKIDRCHHALSALETIAAAAAEEIARLKRRAEHADAAAAMLKRYIIAVMEAHQMKRLEGHTTGFTLRHNAPSVEIANEEAIPDEFLVTRENTAIDKKLIKQALVAGRSVEGARLVQTVSLVRR